MYRLACCVFRPCRSLAFLIAATGLIGVIACGSSGPSSSANPSGGASGNAGTGGHAGSALGGTAGNAGNATGGSAGSALGGTAGNAGTGATAGDAQAGAAGDTSVAQAMLSVAPQPLYDFGTVTVHLQSTPFALTVTNTGDATSGALTAATLTGAGADQFKIDNDGCVGKKLAPNANCKVVVEMAPTVVGTATATWSISASPGESTSTALTGEAVAVSSLQVTPEPAVFGNALAPGGTSEVTLTVHNTGDTTSGPIMMSLSGTNQTQYSIIGGTCMSSPTLAPDARCTSIVRFAPTIPGPLPATLVANATPGGSSAADLTGVGLAPANLEFTQNSLSFATVDLGASGQQTLTLSNTGDVPSGNLSFVTSNAAFNVVAGGTCAAGAPLNGGASCTVTVQFSPTVMGTTAASITASATPGGDAGAGLSGIGRKTVKLTITKTGNGGGTIVVDGTMCAADPCVVNYKITDGSTVAQLTAAGLVSSDFAGWGLGCSGTGACQPAMDQDRTVQATFTLKKFSVQVTLNHVRAVNGGVVAATAVPPGPALNCVSNVCSAQYDYGSTVTLNASASNQAIFQSFGTPCSPRVDSACSTGTITAAFSTTATFRPKINYVFITSDKIVPSTIGASLDVADAHCDALALTAGLADTRSSAPGARVFKALLSTSAISAHSRLDAAQGWILPNGKEVANKPQDLFGENGSTAPLQMFYPILVDETGAPWSDGEYVATGSDNTGSLNGNTNNNCGDWTSLKDITLGTPQGGNRWWIYRSIYSAQCGIARHLYCFETGQPKATVAVTPPAQARYAFMTAGTFSAGGGRSPASTPGTADALCEAEKGSLPGNYLALLSVTGASGAASLRFDLTGPTWVRPDGVLLAATPTELMSFQWTAALDQTAAGSYMITHVPWVGSTKPNLAAAGTGNDCADWTNGTNSASGTYSVANLDLYFSSYGSGGDSCNAAHNVFCLQQ